MSNLLSDEEIRDLLPFYDPDRLVFAHAIIEAYRAKLIAGVVIPEPTLQGDRGVIKKEQICEGDKYFTLTQLQEAVAAARLQGAKEERESVITFIRENYQDYITIDNLCEAIRVRGES